MTISELLYTPLGSLETADPALAEALQELITLCRDTRGDLPPLTPAAALNALARRPLENGLYPPPPDPVTGARLVLAARGELPQYPDRGLEPAAVFPDAPTPICLSEMLPHLGQHPRATAPSSTFPATLSPAADVRLSELSPLPNVPAAIGTLGGTRVLCRHIPATLAPAPVPLEEQLSADIDQLLRSCQNPPTARCAAIGLAAGGFSSPSALWAALLGLTHALSGHSLPLLPPVFTESQEQTAGLWLFLAASLV